MRIPTAASDVAARLGISASRARTIVSAPRPRLALIDPAGETPLSRALAHRVDLTLITRPSLAARSIRFDRVLCVVGGTEEHGATLALARFGAAVLLTDGFLPAAYARRPGRGRALAATETGRLPDAAEWAHWLAGTLRPPRLLADAASCGPLLVHSSGLQRVLSERFGVRATVIPMALDDLPSLLVPGRVALHGGTQAGEAAVWALEQVRAWGIDATLAAAVPEGVAARLGVARWVSAPSGGAVEAFLAMPGQSSLGAALARALAAGRRCIASRWLLEGIDAPEWTHPVPDEPSPPLLAEAIADALARPRPCPAVLAAYRRRHAPAAAARAVCAALGLDT